MMPAAANSWRNSFGRTNLCGSCVPAGTKRTIYSRANFAKEARKIHYGEAEAEGIYGQATREEREALKDEGIEIFDMPWVPPDH